SVILRSSFSRVSTFTAMMFSLSKEMIPGVRWRAPRCSEFGAAGVAPREICAGRHGGHSGAKPSILTGAAKAGQKLEKPCFGSTRQKPYSSGLIQGKAGEEGFTRTLALCCRLRSPIDQAQRYMTS